MAVRFIGVDDAGKITGTVAKPAIEAVAKPLVDAAEARLTPKPILKTVPLQAAKADGAADGPTNALIRMIVNVNPVATRWRLRLRNAGATAQGSGELTSVGVYHAATPQSNKALIPNGSPRVVSDFTISGTTEYVSPWVSGATARLGGGVDYTISFTVRGATTMVTGASTIPIYTMNTTVYGGDTSVVPTLASKVPLSVVVEYEAEYSQGAIAQGGLVQLSREEWLAAKTAGSLDPSVFYAVTEAL